MISIFNFCALGVFPGSGLPHKKASIEFVFIVRTQIRFFAGCKKTSILGKLKLGAITFVQRKNYNLHKWFSLNEACFCHFLIRRCICLKTKSCGIKFLLCEISKRRCATLSNTRLP